MKGIDFLADLILLRKLLQLLDIAGKLYEIGSESSPS